MVSLSYTKVAAGIVVLPKSEKVSHRKRSIQPYRVQYLVVKPEQRIAHDEVNYQVNLNNE